MGQAGEGSGRSGLRPSHGGSGLRGHGPHGQVSSTGAKLRNKRKCCIYIYIKSILDATPQRDPILNFRVCAWVGDFSNQMTHRPSSVDAIYVISWVPSIFVATDTVDGV